MHYQKTNKHKTLSSPTDPTLLARFPRTNHPRCAHNESLDILARNKPSRHQHATSSNTLMSTVRIILIHSSFCGPITPTHTPTHTHTHHTRARGFSVYGTPPPPFHPIPLWPPAVNPHASHRLLIAVFPCSLLPASTSLMLLGLGLCGHYAPSFFDLPFLPPPC